MISYLQGNEYLKSKGYADLHEATPMDYCSIGLVPTNKMGAYIHTTIKEYTPDLILIDGEPLIVHSIKLSFPRMKIVVLLNPNNPIGNVYTEDELEKVIEKTKKVGAIVIIDEAYHYFYPNTFLKYALNEENVVLLRTFSKLFSIAACRLGVVISNPQIIHYVKNAKLTFDANAIALLFAERILDHPDMIEQLIETEKEGKAYTLAELTKHGYETRDCRGNYIFVTPKHQATEVAQKLETEKKILVKSYGNEMLKKYLRISVGSKDAMERFLTAFFEIDERA